MTSAVFPPPSEKSVAVGRCVGVVEQSAAQEREDLVDYINWAEQVVVGCRGGNAWLDNTFNEAVAQARSSL